MVLIAHPIRLPVFEGPLDLLLQLIEREELDITTVSLVQVTDQYLRVIEEMGRRGMADLTAFLVVGSRLVLIKSQALLPRPPTTRSAAEEDVAADLIRQLEEYRRFKRAAQELAQREEEGRRAYLRISPLPPAPVTFDLSEATLNGLLAAAQEALQALPQTSPDEIIRPTVLTVADQIERIEALLVRRATVRFDEVLAGAASRIEVIITLLAVLELIKQDQVQVWQDALFGPIFIAAQQPEPSRSSVPDRAQSPPLSHR